VKSAAAFGSCLGPFIARYLKLKRALGRRYANEGSALTHLDRFLARQTANLTAETFALWSAAIGHLSPTVRRGWMRVVRNLCLYRQRSESACFVPDPAGFPQPHQTRRPHLFTDEQIVRLLRATDDLQKRPTSPLRREVFRLALVLLYTAGLRRGEIVRLTLADYAADEQTLTIRESKFHKSRLVPLSLGAAREMDTYLVARRRFSHAAEAPLLCCNRQGLRHYTGMGLAQGLRQIFRSVGIRTATGHLPHVHDMRHTFAHAALLRWYRTGIDIEAKLPALAAYMGHVSVVSTQYYLSFFEPVAEKASERFARHCAPFVRGVNEGGVP
jgi:Site-specific recombinase XerD